jgi:hypothetical protein
MAAPYVASMILDTSMRVSNGLARAELGWDAQYSRHSDGIEAIAAALAVCS